MTSGPLRVLGLATYPALAAATRQRVLQYVPLLSEHGVQLDVRPFLSNEVFAGLYDRRRAVATAGGILAGIARRIRDVILAGRYDVAFIQREAALVGPPVVEWLLQRQLPLVLDLDDATYLTRPSETFGVAARLLKSRSKTDRLIRWASQAICGSPNLASYVAQAGTPATVLPTIVDVERFIPRVRVHSGKPVIGWIGTHSTVEYLRMILPALEAIARVREFRLLVIGGLRAEEAFASASFEVEIRPWRLEREIEDLQSFDLALYPLKADEWAEGKSGYKAIQYLSCGIPYVASPVGVVRDLGVPGETHLVAGDLQSWVDSLLRLLDHPSLRMAMSEAGRRYAVEHFSLHDSARILAGVLRRAAE